jgi:hypothetical protein
MTAAGPAAPAPTLVWQRDAALVAYARNLVVVRWTGVPRTPQLAALARAHHAAAASGADVLIVNDVADVLGSPQVDRAARAQMLDLVTERRDRTRAVAHVVEVPGPIGVAVRTFLRAIEVAAGNGRASTRTFERLEPAAAWLAAIDPDQGWTEDEIERVWRALVRPSTLAA